jgi:gamma-glutamyltranspeptidase / glutathione hydrolase
MAAPTRGVVAAGDPQTAEAGRRALLAGGNAFDAALSAAFAAFVCELPLCSPLGGGVLVARDGRGTLHAIDLFARTPGLGGRPDQLDFAHVTVDFGATTQVFHVGRGSAAVPLALPGLLEAHRRWGSLPLAEVVAPAVELGTRGYELGPGVAYVFHLLAPIVCRTPECRALFTDGPELARAGARLRNPHLADTLEQIARRPETVRELYAALARELGPSEGGLIGAADVASIAVADVAPLTSQHRDQLVVSMPAPSSGGVLVLLGLRSVLGSRELAFLSPEHVVRLLEAQAGLLAVRGADFDERCRDDAWVRSLLETKLGSTTHMSAIDEHGAAVALTLTNGEGSGSVLAGTGMVVNNLLGEEDIHPRGFHLDPPGSPLATMMAPSLVLGPDLLLALGSGGSNRLRNAILSVLSHVLEHGRELSEAVAAPRFHVERQSEPPGRRVAFERPGLTDAAAEAARAFGSAVEFPAPNMYFGGVHVAARRAQRLFGAGDPRRGGSVRVA